MGLFSGIVNSIFGGGGGTSVQQQAANTTQVDVGVTIQNVMDLTGITSVLEWLGLKDAENSKRQTEAIQAASAQSTTDIQALIAAINGQQDKQLNQQKAMINNVLPYVQGVAVAAILALGVFTYSKWRKMA